MATAPLFFCLFLGALGHPAIVSEFIQERSFDFEWTAWGDSYASGVGAGMYVDGRRCLRYDRAYPEWISEDAENLYPAPSPTGGKFNNVVCSGATTEDVVLYQLYTQDTSSDPNWQYSPRPSSGKPRMGTLTVGGDNIDFVGILSNCIIEGFPWPLSNCCKARTCDQQRDITWRRLSENGDRTTPNSALVANISETIQQISTFGRAASGNDFRLFVTGYGRFFNDVDSGCDSVTFARTANPKDDGKPHIKMTTELRKEFNAMTLLLNKAIELAVSLNAVATGGHVEYVDIDGMLDGHRFCEPGIQEPDQANANLWFNHYPYHVQGEDDTDAALVYLNSIVESNEASIAFDVTETLWTDYINDAWSLISEQDAQAAVDAQAAATNVSSQVWSLWGDIIGYRVQVFHPQVAYHQAIYRAIVEQYTRTITSQYAAGTCYVRVNEEEYCENIPSVNLLAEVVMWDASGVEMGRTGHNGSDPGRFQSINDGFPLRMTSKLPVDLVVTGEHQNDYVQFTLETDPPLSWTSGTSESDSPDAWCSTAGWIPCSLDVEQGFPVPGLREIDCWFKC